MFGAKWSEIALAKWEACDVVAEIDRLQTRYTRWAVALGLVILLGLLMCLGEHKPHEVVLGVLLIMVGVIQLAVLRIGTHVKLTGYQVLWAQQQGKGGGPAKKT